MVSRERITVITLTVFVWALAGAVFGSLFAGLYQVLAALGLGGWQPTVLAALGAAGTTSAFYSAMPVALLGAMAGVLASIGYLMANGQRVELVLIAGVAAAAGVVAGGFYAWLGAGRSRPLAETLTGLIAGLAAGLLLWLGLDLYGGPISMAVMAAGVVAVVGGIFKLAQGRIVGLLSGGFLCVLSAPLVAGLIAAVVGACVWIMTGASGLALDLSARQTIADLLGQVPSGFIGGMVGGAITGALLEIVGVRLEEDEHFV